jgi:predicted metal-dependent hydrolase
LVIQGLLDFNAGEYFEAHELLETAWRNESRSIRELYRGILQVGVGFYHIQRENFSGAHKLFQRALGWLSPFPSICQSVNVEKIRLQTLKIDAFLISTLPKPSKASLESLFFSIEFGLGLIGE